MLVNDLILEAESIPFDDYAAAAYVISKFERFFGMHHEYFYSQYITESTGIILADFEQMRRAKSYTDKSQYYLRGKRALIHDMTVMKQNRVPQ